MSDNNVESGNKSKSKVTVKEESTTPSGDACICKDERNLLCLLHGG